MNGEAYSNFAKGGKPPKILSQKPLTSPSIVQVQEEGAEPFFDSSVLRIFKWIFVIILIFLFFCAGLIYANEKDYLKLGLEKYYNAWGLEKLWRGYPKDPTIALVQISKDYKKIDSNQDQGSIKIIGKTDLSIIIDLIKRMPGGNILGETSKNIILFAESNNDSNENNVLKDKEENFSLKIDFQGKGKIKGDAAATINLDIKESVYLLVNLGFDTGEEDIIKIETVTTDENYYLKASQLEQIIGEQGKKWYQIPKSFAKKDLLSLGPKKQATQITKVDLESMILSGIRGKDRDEKGVLYYFYEYDFDFAKVYQAFGGRLSSEEKLYIQDSSLKVNFWIDKKDHLLKKFSANIEIKIESKVQGTITLENNISGINQNYVVERPDSSEILTIEEMNKIIKELRKKIFIKLKLPYDIGSMICKKPSEGDDKIRKPDLLEIDDALDNYHAETKSFPLASVIEKTSDKNSAIYRALVPKYLIKLPQDPDSCRFYGYKSDGIKYELSAVLDNKDDPDGVKIGDKTLYILK